MGWACEPTVASLSAVGHGNEGLAKASAGDDEFASEPLRILGGEEGDDACDVIGLASASEISR